MNSLIVLSTWNAIFMNCGTDYNRGCCRIYTLKYIWTNDEYFVLFDLHRSIVQVSGYCGLLLGIPVILYEIIAFVLPGLTKNERKFLGPIVLGSSILFYVGIAFSYMVLTPAALTFFVNYAEGAVESLWSIDQYFEFVLVLMFSTGLSFQVRFFSLNSRFPVLCMGISYMNLKLMMALDFFPINSRCLWCNFCWGNQV